MKARMGRRSFESSQHNADHNFDSDDDDEAYDTIGLRNTIANLNQ